MLLVSMMMRLPVSRRKACGLLVLSVPLDHRVVLVSTSSREVWLRARLALPPFIGLSRFSPPRRLFEASCNCTIFLDMCSHRLGRNPTQKYHLLKLVFDQLAKTGLWPASHLEKIFQDENCENVSRKKRTRYTHGRYIWLSYCF